VVGDWWLVVGGWWLVFRLREVVGLPTNYKTNYQSVITNHFFSTLAVDEINQPDILEERTL
jgi:hypothetical protein